MFDYLPWSQSTLNMCLDCERKGQLSTIDFEFSAKCEYANCIYCDSKPKVGDAHNEELTFEDSHRVLTEAKALGLKWLYCCGLGEPTEDKKFIKFIELAKSLNIKTSIFSNGISITDLNFAKWLYRHDVSLILKFDTLDEKTFDIILGGVGRARKIYRALDFLLSAGFSTPKSDTTKLAFSIVPTTLNISHIEDVFKFAVKNHIFPSIGELEYAGMVANKQIFDNLNVKISPNSKLKKRLNTLWGGSYCRPLCPAIVTGIHINHLGDCVVDSLTGLNCKWFTLKESKMASLGSVKDYSISDLYQKVRSVKKSKYFQNRRNMDALSKLKFTFGGCGGSPKNIIKLLDEQMCNE